MAHRKAGGSTKNLRDSKSKRLGVKLFGGEKARPGMIVLRQRGTKWHPGEGVRIGNDDTIYAVREGVVKFSKKKVRKFHGNLRPTRFVSVIQEN